MKQYTLAVVTSTRAEYGLLRPLLEQIQSHPAFRLALVVTGAHLSQQYGSTVQEIEQDNMPIAERIPILDKAQQGPAFTAHTVAYTIQAFSDWFVSHRPNAVVVLGDRYEIFAVAQAAAMTGLPLVHISGGDVTLGAQDDYYRHCITKMAQLHFPSCETYARRLICMGEQSSRVVCVGGLGDENIRTMEKLTLAQLSESLQMPLEQGYGLVTFHPETAGGADPKEQMKQLLAAMETISKETGLQWVVTKSNADDGGLDINAMWDQWTEEHPQWGKAFFSLGVKRYLSAMQYAAVVLGNSSSGVVETPTFGIPTVNVGRRQEGRIICDNVLCCDSQQNQIEAALRTALSEEFRKKAAETKSPYNGGNTSQRMVQAMLEWLEDPNHNAPKVFYDVPFPGQEE